jgi:glycosyltransferase involved in cell wall biosynthesis
MTSKGNPLISIGMPVRNCQESLSVAIWSLLAQSYTHWELFLIDDGSWDKTLSVARQFKDPRIRVHSDGKWRGLAARLNEAIGMSRGQYFARMDGDDIAYPERFQWQVSYLRRHPDVDLVGAWVMVFGENGIPLGKRAGPQEHANICRKPYAGFPMAHPTYMGRLEWFQRYGYRTEASRCEDQDLLLRSYRFSRFANVPGILLGYFEHKIQLTKVLASRWFFTQILVRTFCQEQRPHLAIRALLEQTLKAFADCLAVTSGLGHRLLRHRARPVTDAEKSSWKHVWNIVNKSE